MRKPKKKKKFLRKQEWEPEPEETHTQWPWFFPSVFSDNFAEGEELNSRFTEITRGSVYLLETMREVAEENQRIYNLF